MEQVSPTSVVELNTVTLQVLGAIGGMLVGALVYMTKQLISSKDEQIKEARRESEYWQNMSLGLMGSARRAIDIAEQQLPPPKSTEIRTQ